MPIDDGKVSAASEEAHETPFAVEKRWALVIGVNETASSLLAPLRHAEQDALDVAAILSEQACGFRLCQPPLIGKQATSNAIKTALRAFGKERSEDDFLLLYFSGHGIIRLGEANEQMVYLGSADFVESDGEEEAETHVSLKWLRRWLYEKTNAKRVLLILDCCFAGEMGRTAPDHYIKDLQDRIRFYLEGTGSSSDARWGGLRLTLTATGHLMGASDEDGQKRMAEHLLPALQGKIDEVIEDDGAISIERLRSYLYRQLPEQQPSLSGDFAGCSCVLANYPEYAKERARTRNQGQNRQAERIERLRIALADHSAFLQNRLASFVGRVNELGELERRIEQLLPTGGYLTITGQAGQGKSSISAKLIERRGIDQTAFHFIPLNPGPGHQIGLLRNLLARLILKYDLSDLYLASESRAALHDALLALLNEVTSKGGQEVLFIDGLDQLEEEQTGGRDLSFLPANPPAGIVFVLGTRPNDALRPLELLKPHMTYPLPNLSREDFDLILQHRQVTLSSVLADRFYEAMQQNALYLDLVAKELTEQQQQPLKDLIQRLTENPEHLFSLATDRFKRQWGLWCDLIKPILSLLLVVQEPLSKRQMRKILDVDADSLNEGLEHLGGLVIRDEHDQYSLYHSKFRDFLQEDPARPQKQFIFDQDEIAGWHLRVAQWCEQSNIMAIWADTAYDATEQGRRLYARSHYLAHLYYARQWQQLFAVLDEGAFGHAKLAHDPSMRSYSLDLVLGEKAASWEHYSLEQGIDLLPVLWRYSLLRCHLASRADSYPDEAFETMILLDQSVKAVGIAELLDPIRKVRVLLLIARLLEEHKKQHQEAAQLVKRAMVVASLIERTSEKDEASSLLASYFADVQQWQDAERIMASMLSRLSQASALSSLASSLAQAGEHEEAKRTWQDAERIITSMQDSGSQAWALNSLASSLAQAQLWEDAERVIAFMQNSYSQAWALSNLAISLAEAQQWEDAERVIASMQHRYSHAQALNNLASSLAQAGEHEEAKCTWQEAERIIASMQHSYSQAWALNSLANSLAQVQQWQEAERIIASMQDSDSQAWALNNLASSLAQAQQWEEAERVIASMKDNDFHAQSLSDFANSLAQAGEHEGAKRIWQEAEYVIASMQDSGSQASALNSLTSSLTQAQQWQEVERIIASMQDSDSQASALIGFANSLAQAGEHEGAKRIWQEAERIIASMQHSYSQAWASSSLASSLTQTQQWEDAERVIASMQDSDSQTWASSSLASSLAEAQQWEDAERVIASMQNSYYQASALNLLASSLFEAQQWETFLGIIQRFWKSAKTNEEALALFPLALNFIPTTPELGMRLYDGFGWVDEFLRR